MAVCVGLLVQNWDSGLDLLNLGLELVGVSTDSAPPPPGRREYSWTSVVWAAGLLLLFLLFLASHYLRYDIAVDVSISLLKILSHTGGHSWGHAEGILP